MSSETQTCDGPEVPKYPDVHEIVKAAPAFIQKLIAKEARCSVEELSEFSQERIAAIIIWLDDHVNGTALRDRGAAI